MSRIIPAILTNNLEEIKRLIDLISPHAELIHFDIINGTLIPEETIHNPEIFKNLHIATQFEVHLIINNPEKIVRDWVDSGAARIIIHAESVGNIGAAIEEIKRYGRKAGLSINPETPLEIFAYLFDVVDFVQLMSVIPGGQGRPFHANVFDKISWLKKQYPHLRIAVDGGVNESNIIELVRAGAEDLVAGSAIVNSANPVEALKNLRRVLG